MGIFENVANNISHLETAINFSKKENLLKLIKKNGLLKCRNKPTMSPYIMAIWKLDEMVEKGTLIKNVVSEGKWFNRKSYNIYKLKNKKLWKNI